MTGYMIFRLLKKCACVTLLIRAYARNLFTRRPHVTTRPERRVVYIAESRRSLALAASLLQAIYTIPPSSPIHYVTYVHVYGYTPTTVYMGHTPGYFDTMVS
jgi:hypothetical protein